jgi:hypothetical protein
VILPGRRSAGRPGPGRPGVADVHHGGAHGAQDPARRIELGGGEPPDASHHTLPVHPAAAVNQALIDFLT